MNTKKQLTSADTIAIQLERMYGKTEEERMENMMKALFAPWPQPKTVPHRISFKLA